MIARYVQRCVNEVPTSSDFLKMQHKDLYKPRLTFTDVQGALVVLQKLHQRHALQASEWEALAQAVHNRDLDPVMVQLQFGDPSVDVKDASDGSQHALTSISAYILS